MKRIIISFVIIVLSIFLFSLYGFYYYEFAPLGCQYFHLDQIGAQSLSIEMMSGIYHRTPGKESYSSRFGDPIFEGGILDVKHNRNYIVVSQCEAQIDSFHVERVCRHFYSIPYYYWIIDKRTHEVLGPLSINELNRFSSNRNIPKIK